ncbi:MAG: carboxymuconolactone decarboxylase family protein [Desulfosporosinus sp.]|jgi:4-carboxymuconolactone decarboxylase
MSRIPLMPLEEMSEKTRNMIIGGKSKMSVLNINKMVAHADNSARHFMRMGTSLMTQAKLDARLRELAILRIAHLCDSRYEWYQHEKLAKEVGVTEQQISAVREEKISPIFNEQERAVLKYTEEVTINVKSSEESFAEVAKFLSNRELVELTLTIGFYNLVARLLENTGVEIE